MTISDPHPDFDGRRAQWDKIKSALEGEDEIKAAGTQFLPKPEGMTPTEYAAYKTRASFFAVAERTLRGMTGAIMRNAPTIELPAKLTPMRQVATYDGHSLDVLIDDVLREVLSVGRYGLLLDFPAEGATSQTLPYISTFEAQDIRYWEQRAINGQLVLTRIVLAEEPDSDDKEVEQFLELSLTNAIYHVRRYQVKGDTEWVVDELTPTVNGKPLDRIPFVCVSPYDLRPDIEKPPMLDLVNLNLAHYRNSADFENALFKTAQPTPYVTGNISEDKKPTAIGSNAFWVLPEGATVGMLEFSGAGLSAQKDAMLDKENRMAALGARMLSDGKNRNEASDTARMRGRSELSLLNSAVNMTEAAITAILRMAADWTQSNRDEVSVTLNRDYVETRLGPQEVTALVKAWQSGAISQSTLLHNLQRGEIVPAGRSFDDEKDLIEEEGGGMENLLTFPTA